MDRLLRGSGGALSWDGAGKINPRALSQLSKGYRLEGLMNILWPIFSGKSKPAVSWSEERRTLACQGGTAPHLLKPKGGSSGESKLDVYDPLHATLPRDIQPN